MDLEGLAAGKPRNGHVLVGKTLSLGSRGRQALFVLVFASLEQQVEFPGKPELLGHLGGGSHSRVPLGGCASSRSISSASVIGLVERRDGGLNGGNRGRLGALGSQRDIARRRYPRRSLLLGIVPLKGIQLSQRLELLLESRNGMHSRRCIVVALELQG